MRGEFLTTEQAAKLLQVSPLTIRRWCASGLLPALKLGHRWRVSRGKLDELIHQQIDDRMASGNGLSDHSEHQ